MTTQVVFSDEFNKHDTADHPENADRVYVMLDALEQAPFYHDLEIIAPEMIPEQQLYELHSADMIQRIKDISAQGDSWIDLDTYVCAKDYETARLAAGGVALACRNVMSGNADNAFALVRPPGHHASRDRSMGFCLFNNAGLAAHEQTKHGKRVLIFDHDVHHGNGTQSMFYDRNDIMYQSLHLSPHYPGTGTISEVGVGKGAGYNLNTPLAFGHDDRAVTQLLDEVFIPVASQFKPQLILVSVGYDAHHADPLGGLHLTANFFGELIKKLQTVQPKIVCTLEGGYNLQWIGKCFVSQMGQLAGHPVHFQDAVKGNDDVSTLITALKKELGAYWKL
ncbi:MAG: histone deacetylase [Candidatus Thermoplasmatota archaeon]|nr:histone deacetylase [Candidatus Thermoplasmatota archaeon]